jgi:6-phosphogluconolactonase
MSSGRLSRAVFLKAAVGLAGAALAASSSTAARAQGAVMQARVTLGGAQVSQWMVYVGCYTTPDRFGHGHGISVYRMDAATGDWTAVQVLEGLANPSFLALDPAQQHLYCVHGGNNFRQVSAFAIDSATGQLSHLNSQDCGGPNPVHLSVDPSDRALVVADYNTGEVGVLPILPDGTLGQLSDLVMLPGQPGPHKTEQTGSHPHNVPFDPAGHFVVVPDKGLDRIFVMRLDAAQAKLELNDPPFAQARHGAGPRHIAFHRTLPYAYVINELDSTITTYGYDSDVGVLEPLQVLASTPTDFTGDDTGAEIVVAPSGRFVYGSNRGHDSVGVFAVDEGTGLLSPVGWVPTGGKTPRNFNLDPSGQFLYVGNQDSDTVVTFAVDDDTGALTPTGQVIETGSPVSIVFAAV